MNRLPVLVSPYGAYAGLALHVHDLTIRGHHTETLSAADEAEAILTQLGDRRTHRISRLGRMYALNALGRLDEALQIGEELIADQESLGGPKATDAKILADVARVLIHLGRIDDGLHHVASAMALLDVAPRKGPRYFSAMSSLGEAARSADLFELSDEAMRRCLESFDSPDVLYRSAAELTHTELWVEWALRLEQVGRDEEAAGLISRSTAVLEFWLKEGLESPLGTALLAVCHAKSGRIDEALAIIDELLPRMHAAGQHHESRLLHLAQGLAMRATGQWRAAHREFRAGLQLAALKAERLLFQYELAVTAALEVPGEATQAMLEALRTHVEALWQLRLDRRTMLRQAYRRVELEAARTSADLAAASDALTGLGNRRMFDRRINTVVDGGTLLLIDVDHFKDINDRYSHGVGDRVLGEIAAVLRSHCRHDEVAIRFGGDEFALFLATGEAEARKVAERIRRVIQARDWNTIMPGLKVTLSMGLAACRPGEAGRELYDRADAHLYVAKRSGRDQLAAAAA
ncbi:diguanylate cyclase [Actinoplanes philippinensis]|uniref:Diguanylate cyclase (GGDEF) domain-containing protein n=1 Tax=Actinoplanes philippinensis TaxID=35752 RepID=A0A1I2HJM3_9ACTN|nr:GGDEF domain-containing protein [Actinoplanes philippinensis]GIE74084.1 diguanylate cyclase [Actinoplanes philippinensis]SFF30354.1 diguanylate cyclase (GGDEF) domain-containing protein [Actinoplanes philippinensis]